MKFKKPAYNLFNQQTGEQLAIELKESYYDMMVKNMANVVALQQQGQLF